MGEVASTFFLLAAEVWGEYVLISQGEGCERYLCGGGGVSVEGAGGGGSEHPRQEAQQGARSSFSYVCRQVATHRLLQRVNGAIDAAPDQYDGLSGRLSSQLGRLVESNVPQTARGCLEKCRDSGLHPALRLTCLIEEVLKSCSAPDERLLVFLCRLLVDVRAEEPSVADYLHVCAMLYCPPALGLVPVSAETHFSDLARLYGSVSEECAWETSEATKLGLYEACTRLSQFYWMACLFLTSWGAQERWNAREAEGVVRRMAQAVENLEESLWRLGESVGENVGEGVRENVCAGGPSGAPQKPWDCRDALRSGYPISDPKGQGVGLDALSRAMGSPGFQNIVVCSFSALIGASEALLLVRAAGGGAGAGAGGSQALELLRSRLSSFRRRFGACDSARDIELEKLAGELGELGELGRRR